MCLYKYLQKTSGKIFHKPCEKSESGKINAILTDQYAGINSKEFKQYLTEKKIALVFTAVDWAFSNGLNERTNQTLINRIRCKIQENKNKP